jgi:hypothetical protein
MQIDKDWFTKVIEESPFKSQRQLALKMKADPSSISRMFAGERLMKLEEARVLAELLTVPLIDVLRHAGIHIPEDPGTLKIPVWGIINAEGVIEKPTGSTDFVYGPKRLPVGSIACRYQTAGTGGNHDFMDGWVLYAEKPEPYDPSMMGKIAIVIPERGRPMIGFVMRGYKAGAFNVMTGPWGAFRVEKSVRIKAVAPALWISPSST